MELLAILVLVVGAVIYLLSLAASMLIGYALRGRLDQRKWQSHGKYVVIVGFTLWTVSAFYFEFHPDDDFYLKEFSIVALRDPPNLARVVAKSASLFGLHSGESCSYSRIQVSQQDYLR